MSMVFHRMSQLATALALLVVVLGAWVRLTDAGLGCPDWPGCYGQLGVPSSVQ
ncbi:MAG: COX15/CtaA family protein, partial [Pseudomonadota bacterium]